MGFHSDRVNFDLTVLTVPSEEQERLFLDSGQDPADLRTVVV